MSFKTSATYSILGNKCPKCHQGDFFIESNPYNLKKFDKMHHRCPVCNENFERETGFYYGAMYVSYGLTVGFGIFLFLLMSVLFNAEVLTYIITFAVLQIILMPLFFRLSRLVWINIFVKYKKEVKS